MILKVKNLVKNYYKDNEKIEAVNNISYNFEKGKFYAIMGPSGSGKSTFLHLIGTLDTYDEGSVFINNIDVSKYVSPPLSTFNIDINELCKTAINLLSERIIEDRKLQKTIYLNCELIIRKSFIIK